jgi:hypothetical protein
MNTQPHLLRRLLVLCPVAAVLAWPASLAAENRKNPASKIYVSDVGGEAQIDTGDKLSDISKHDVYSAQGTVIETKAPENEQDKIKHFSTMVYSNGTGAFFDADTRVEVRKFEQEPFTPTRSDVEVEPSISKTQAFLARGTVGLCASKLVAGSTMVYSTPQGSVNIRGRKVVISATGNETKISMLEGESTIQGGTMDMGGHTVHTGEQAVIRPGAAGQPNIIDIHPIPSGEAQQLDDKVSMACMAKKTVYFEVRERTNSGSGPGGTVTAFDGGNAENGGGNSGTSEIVPVEVVPAKLPVQFTISPATLTTPSGNVITPGQGQPPGG